METKYVHTCMAILGFFMITTHAMNQSIVVACNFDATGSNLDTSKLISSALYSAKHILSCFSWKSLWNLRTTVEFMKRRGDEIAQTTPGITNTIKKLFTELEQQKYGTFGPDTIACFNEMGVNPIPDYEAIGLLQAIKSWGIPIIGTGNKDSLEYEIYSRKMLDNHNIDTHHLFDGIITIPTLDEQTQLNDNSSKFFQRSDHWIVCRGTRHEPSHAQAICRLSNSLRPNVQIIPIDTKDELSFLCNALSQVNNLRPPSPEPVRLLDDLFKERTQGESIFIRV